MLHFASCGTPQLLGYTVNLQDLAVTAKIKFKAETQSNNGYY